MCCCLCVNHSSSRVFFSFLVKVVFNHETLPGQYRSFQDGKFFKDNKLLGEQETSISLGLYIDDFEVCNPSRKIYKMTAVYWVVLNIPAKFCSSLHSIQQFLERILMYNCLDMKSYSSD